MGDDIDRYDDVETLARVQAKMDANRERLANRVYPPGYWERRAEWLLSRPLNAPRTATRRAQPARALVRWLRRFVRRS